MQRGIGGRARGLLATVVALMALVALPAVASAGRATSGSGVQFQRESFMRYMYGFGGTVSASGTGTFARNTTAFDDDTLTFTFDATNTTYNITRTAGSGTLALLGGISYQMPAHYIDVSVSDPRVAITSTTATAAVISAVVSYDPLESGTQIRNPTTPTRIDVFRVDLSSVFSGSGTRTHTWTRAPAVLTADGARAFNGGGNGSYSDGSPFGFWTLSATTPAF